MKLYLNITLLQKIACTLCIAMLCAMNVMSQQSDSVKISLRSRPSKASNHLPEIKANIQPYKPLFSTLGGSNIFGVFPGTKTSNANTNTPKDKLLTIVKIYPNPVDDQLNIILSLSRDTPVAIKIIDLLGNEVVTLSNERLNAGEQTKTFTIPSRLTAGIYFLRVIAGSESQVKRISVL
ncbi:T9SS type A sorting domain-containing protein [Pedobacter changchengzhani]|nr:T9SS type A sorting domain-containing protein [Pedobacter changchengzhani]